MQDNVQTIANYAGIAVTVASALSAIFGLSKSKSKSGPLAAIGKIIDVLALNFGHAKNAK